MANNTELAGLRNIVESAYQAMIDDLNRQPLFRIPHKPLSRRERFVLRWKNRGRNAKDAWAVLRGRAYVSDEW